MSQNPRVGVLALQGDFSEHCTALSNIGLCPTEIRLGSQLAEIDGLIIPGGESTSMMKLIDYYDLRDPLVRFAREGNPIWGTCAGLIVMAQKLLEPIPLPLGLMDLLVQRNAFGRQVDSFQENVRITGIPGDDFRGVFIRAPVVKTVGPRVQVLGRLKEGEVVAVREENLLGTAFHPELTNDPRMHRYFADMVEKSCR